MLDGLKWWSFLGEFSVTIKDEEEEGEFWWLLGFYGPNHYNKRNLFWDELVGLWSLCGQSWCMGGDFNVTLFLSKKSGTSRITRSVRLF